MSIEAVALALNTDPTVALLTQGRISPLERKEFDYPAVVLVGTSEPLNNFIGSSGIDHHMISVAYWDLTYEGAHALAAAGRTALEAAGCLIIDQQDSFADAASLAGAVCVTQSVSLWD